MEAEVYRDVAACYVGYHLRDEEGAELGAVLAVYSVVGNLFLECVDASDAHSVHHADAVEVFLLEVEGGILDTLHGRDKRKLGVTVELARLLAVNPVVDVQSLYLARKLSLELRCVEIGYCCGTALAGQEVAPCFFRTITYGCDST